ncbi:MAG: TadE/TadG family type IV pilus assembly protein [Telluria sp.]
MSDDKKLPKGVRFAPVSRQRGVAAIEFALLAIVFFALVFGTLEIARALYLFNTLQEVTRRAAAEAANSGFDQATIAQVRTRALFASVSGKLFLGDPVTPQHLKIEYLSLARDAGTGALTMQHAAPMPACATKNYLNCLSDPYGASCIRLVRVRVCQPGDGAACTPVPYHMLLPLIDLNGINLPRATTIVPAQTLGRTFGALPCP